MVASFRTDFREFSREKERVENRTAFLKERAEERAAEKLEKWVEKGESIAAVETEEERKFFFLVGLKENEYLK